MLPTQLRKHLWDRELLGGHWQEGLVDDILWQPGLRKSFGLGLARVAPV